jgi:hypothetical protein
MAWRGIWAIFGFLDELALCRILKDKIDLKNKKKMNRLGVLIVLLFQIGLTFGQKLTSDYSQQKTHFQELDTIIERTDPKVLDMGRHQLYIDTTRSSSFYERNPFNSRDLLAISKDYLDDLYDNQKIITFDFEDFPRIWFTLRKYEGEYILNQRCDGQEKVVYFSDSVVYISNVELTLRKIKQVDIREGFEIIVELEKYKFDTDTNSLFIKIQKTERNDVFLMTTNENGENHTSFMTTKEFLKNFDLLVNHCPKEKVIEFDDKFEE